MEKIKTYNYGIVATASIKSNKRLKKGEIRKHIEKSIESVNFEVHSMVYGEVIRGKDE